MTKAERKEARHAYREAKRVAERIKHHKHLLNAYVTSVATVNWGVHFYHHDFEF